MILYAIALDHVFECVGIISLVVADGVIDSAIHILLMSFLYGEHILNSLFKLNLSVIVKSKLIYIM